MVCGRFSSFVLASSLLAACGGDDSPPVDGTTTEAAETSTGVLCDADLDGFNSPECGGTDCNDADPTIYPDAPDSAWQFATVDAAIVGDFVVTGMAIDAAGTLHAVYSDGAETGSQALWHAVQGGDGTWTPTQTSTTADAFGDPSLLLDGGGVLRMLITTTVGETSQVQAGALQGGAWSMEVIGDGYSTAQALTTDGAGALVAVTATDTEATYWTHDGAAWTPEVVGPIGNPVIVRAPDGTMQVVGHSNSILQYCLRGDEGMWACDDVTADSPVGSYGAESFARHGPGADLQVISIDTVDTERLVHRHLQDGTWGLTALSFLPSPLHGYSVVGDGSALHVAAWSEPLSTGVLSYTSFSGGEWSLDETVVEGDRNGWEPSMVVDSGGVSGAASAQSSAGGLSSSSPMQVAHSHARPRLGSSRMPT